MIEGARRLDEVGERRLTSELLAHRYANQLGRFGDDCAAVLRMSAGVVVVTTDPAPCPLVWDLDEPDYYDWGWLLAALNLSDIAASGSEPLGIVTSLTLPNSMLVSEFQRLLDGIDDSCAAVGTSVIGGNIKEAPDEQLRCEATAIGLAQGQPLSRVGAAPGDVLIAIGDTGAFWAGVLWRERQLVLDTEQEKALFRALHRPVPRIGVALDLKNRGFVKSSTDASDGLYAAVASLTTDHGLGAKLDTSEWTYSAWVRDIAEQTGTDPVRLGLGFGDLQLVCAISRDDLAEARTIAAEHDTQLIQLGTVTADTRLVAQVGDSVGLLNNFDNERFTADSQFTAGNRAYSERLLSRPLLEG